MSKDFIDSLEDTAKSALIACDDVRRMTLDECMNKVFNEATKRMDAGCISFEKAYLVLNLALLVCMEPIHIRAPVWTEQIDAIKKWFPGAVLKAESLPDVDSVKLDKFVGASISRGMFSKKQTDEEIMMDGTAPLEKRLLALVESVSKTGGRGRLRTDDDLEITVEKKSKK